MSSRATHAVDGARVRSHIAALATACLLNLSGPVQADLAPAQQSLVDGKIARDGADLFYTIAGASGDYVLVLSGGPGEDIRSMQGVADELGKKYRCIMWEYLSVFSDNQIARLGACELEVRDFWKDPAREVADSDRAAFERLRAATPAYFYDRKKALQMASELKPQDYNFRVPPAFLEAEGKYDIRPKLRTITAPVLLLQGRQDLAGEANVWEAHSLIRNSTLAFIDKCGHMPWLEQPEQTWKIVDEFLAHLPNN